MYVYVCVCVCVCVLCNSALRNSIVIVTQGFTNCLHACFSNQNKVKIFVMYKQLDVITKYWDILL